ncbi:Collagen adhesin precursor [Aerococcus viridans]|nr:Cna B-type domain-containing protein [Aerococcus viridans]SUU15590.1 Collagen adhesin precursor [Aerococcus viridans]
MGKIAKYFRVFIVMLFTANIFIEPAIALASVYGQGDSSLETSSEVSEDIESNLTPEVDVLEDDSLEVSSSSQETKPIVEETTNETSVSSESTTSEESETSASSAEKNSVEESGEELQPVTTIELGAADTENLKTGSEIKVPVYITNTQASLENAIIRFTVDNQYIEQFDNNKAYFPDANEGASNVYSKDNQLIIEYKLGDLASDYANATTLNLQTKDNGFMPNGAQVSVKAEVVQNAQVIMATNYRQYNFVSRQPKVTAQAKTSETKGSADDEDGPAQQVALSYEISYEDTGIGNGTGQSTIETYVISTKVPENLKFDAENSKGWKYDEASRIATYSGSLPYSVYTSPYKSADNLVLLPIDQKEQVSEDIYTTLSINYDNGDQDEKSVQTPITLDQQIQTENTKLVQRQAINNEEVNLITGFEFSFTTTAGNTIQVENGDELTLDPSELNAVLLKYTFQKPDTLDIQDGQTFTYALPEIAHGVTGSGKIEIEGVTVATFNAESNQLVLTFTEAVNDYDNVDMYVNISGEFNTEIFNEKEEITVEVPYQDDTSYTVIIRADKEDYEGTDKKTAGFQYILGDNGEKIEVQRNPTHIDWTVRVNDSMAEISQAKVIDDLGEYLSIEPNSFKIERIVRNFKNEEIGREEVEGLEATITGAGFELNIGDINDAYDITYTTAITRPGGGGVHTINNKARILLDGNENNVSDNFTGVWSKDLPIITKTGNFNAPDKIAWEVKYNYGRENLGIVNLTDILSQGSLIEDSVQIFEVDTDLDGNELSVKNIPVQLSKDLAGNTVFSNLDAEGKAYKIQFASDVPVGLNNVDIKNEVHDDLPQPNRAEATVQVNTIPSGGKVGNQGVDDEGNPYVDWTITMNSEKLNVPSINVKDVFSSDHLEFDTEDTDLYKLLQDDKEVTNFDITPYTHADGRTGFELNITEAGPHTYKFIYRTYYTELGMQQPELANNAELVFGDGQGTGIGETIHSGATLTGPKAGIKKSGKYVLNSDQSKQEIEWTITFNTSKIKLKNPIIKDLFESTNYSYISGSLQVKENDTNFTDYSLDMKAASGFELEINRAETNAVYTIIYRTTADDAGNKTQTNKATLEWQGGKETADASVNKRVAGSNKNGQVVINEDGTKQVNWTINFNTNKNILNNFKLTDTFTPTTSTVKDIQIKSGGKDVTGEFNVSTPSNGQFAISKDKLNAQSYQLTYSTTLSPTEEQQEVKNTAKIEYTGNTESRDKSIAKPTLNIDKKAVGITNGENDADKLITWELNANTDNEKYFVNLHNATIDDVIPEDQELVSGSFKIIRVKDNKDVTQDVTIDVSGNNQFKINLPDGPYQYKIIYQTKILMFPSVNKEKIDRYTNEATLTSRPENSDPITDKAAAHIDYFGGKAIVNTDKVGEQNEDTENIDWRLTVNPNKLPIHDAVISDQLDGLQTYVQDSIKLYDSKGNEVTDYTVNLAEDKRSFTINLGYINDSYTVTYATRLNPNLIGIYNVKNAVKLVGGQEQKQISESTVTTRTQQWFFGGGGSGRTLDMHFQKLDVDSGKPLEGVEFTLYRVKNDGSREKVTTFKTDENGSKELQSQRAGRYILEETTALPDYTKTEPIYLIYGYGEKGNITINIADSSWNPDKFKEQNTDGLIINNEKQKVDVQANKNWIGGANDHPTVYFELYRQVGNGDVEKVPGAALKELPNAVTSVTWEKMAAKDSQGNEYKFSVKEVDQNGQALNLENYEKAEDGLTVTNTAKPTDITVSKKWDDAENQDGIRPNKVQVQLIANGKNIGEPVTLNKDNWSYTFTGLPTHENGQPIDYSVVEVNPTDGYQPTVTKAENRKDLILTNSYQPEKTFVTVDKKWDDANNQDGKRPNEVVVQLLADGVAKGEPVKLSAENGWTYTWDNLPAKSAGKEIHYQVEEKSVADYETTIAEDGDRIIITNSRSPQVMNIPVSKVWNDANNQDGKRPEEVTIHLLANGTVVDSVKLSEENNWQHHFENKPVFNNGQEITYTLTEDTVLDYSTSIKEGVITNSYTPAETSVTVTKEWDDAENQDGIRPESIEVVLTANGKETEHTATLSQEGNWTATWSGLPLKESGKEITYSVKELSLPEGYETTVNDENHGNVIITNTYQPKETSLTVNKVWNDDDNRDGLRKDSVEVQLTDGNQNIGDPITLNKENDWTYTWNKLPVNAKGNPIAYEVVEINVPEGYQATTSDISNGEVTLTNNHEVATRDIAVNKVWDDSDNQDGLRPEDIEVQLTANGKDYGEPVTLNQDNNWTHQWTDLLVNESGESIVYEVKEIGSQDGYTQTVDNQGTEHISLINQHSPAVTTLSVNKVWEDGDNQDGLRPDAIEVQLLANNEPIGNIVPLSVENNWTYTWTDLAVNHAGEAITYEVVELNNIEGYQTDISEVKDGQITITNSHTPAVTEKTVTKKWDDSDNQDGIRPDIVSVNLLANDEIIEHVDLSAENDWTHQFTGLPVYDNGQEIVYSFTEEPVEHYETSIKDGVITNVYLPKETAITVSKEWDDVNNQDGLRPVDVQVALLANGKETGEIVTLNEANNWTATWDGLALNDKGQMIEYTVVETSEAKGYTSAVGELKDGQIVLTNTHTPAVKDVTVNKVWNDSNNQDGIRPDRVKVQLYANGEPQGTIVEIEQTNNWTYTWTNLPVNANGQEIDYTVTEEPVVGYDHVISEEANNQFTITNSHIPAVKEFKVNKEWDDFDNQDGLRPDNISVQLQANGENIGEAVTLSADNDWSYNWSNLPVFQSGQPVTYEVVETPVNGYVQTVEYLNGNAVVTNKHTPLVKDLSISKKWVDGDNQDGNRPDSIQVALLANGKATGQELTLSEATNWVGEWHNLPVNAAGVKVEYSVVEIDKADEYEVSLDKSNPSEFILTNSYEPAETSVSVNKVWDDANNQDGVRPDEVTINLLADGHVVDSTTLSEANNWQHEFTRLPLKDNGNDITYTFTENTVENYSTTISGKTVTNSYTPGKTSVTVTKSWNDSNNQDGNRPENIEVTLLADGQPTKQVATLDAKNDWTYTWDNLSLKNNGQNIEYSVVENNADEIYQVTVDDSNHGNIILTNNYTPAEKAITVNKVWDDADNKDGIRPEEVSVQLLANGEPQGKPVKVSADSDWRYTWTGLPVNQAGKSINYDIVEVDVAKGYEATISEAKDKIITVKNTHTPYKRVSVGDYIWIDENKDGLQDSTDIPLAGIVLTIEDEAGNPVTDVDGNLVGPQTTDGKGYYSFDNLPADKTYVVRIDREASAKALEGLEPTSEGVGNDKAIDSSTWTATSRHLVEDGDRDPTLDFGFVRKVEEPEEPVEPEKPVEPEVPVEPEEPVEPEVPVEPEEPVEPEVPVEPEEPEEIETPESPETPGKSESSKASNMPSKQSVSSETEESDSLPATGYESRAWIGLTIFVTGLGLFVSGFIKSKRRKQ